ncbi:MAG: polyphosphate polymerase domain-containing protein [Anaerolineaceae bacterium]|nr:polyphosphate polymerase domain-containing protein [Anaerolineaceae bacterium]
MMDFQHDSIGKRYEIKLPISDLQTAEARSWIRLSKAGFRIAYPERRVNNLYFDSDEYAAYQDHQMGVQYRGKLRFRWYGVGPIARNGQMEYKRRNGRVGDKLVMAVPGNYDLAKMRWSEIQSSLLANADERFALLLAHALPTLVNHYDREYFVSADGDIRVTLDRQIVSFDQRANGLPNFRWPDPKNETAVLEFKCDIDQAARLSDLLTFFPAPSNAFSKYVDAMDTLFRRG